MTPTPEEIEDAQCAAFWRLTQQARRRHPEALDEGTALLDNTVLDGLEDD
jgi:hypothetical protein